MSDFFDRISKLSPKRLALLAMQLQARLDDEANARHEPIAITGIGCRFPGGADSADRYWALLRDGIDAVSEVPASRWDVDALYDPDPDKPGSVATRWGAFLDDVASFDAGFFRISPREALSMDPQQRLLLEVCWEALEDAGEANADLSGSPTGVYVGIGNSDYHDLLTGGDTRRIDTHVVTGKSFSVASGRISYALGLQGPSLSVDTACSSSLVTAHLALQSLRSGECDLALAGGVHLMLTPDTTVMLSKAHMMAADGRCKTFDASADGFVRGEGCAVVVLKRLSDAMADGDAIYAVIRGAAVNQDGRSNGLTAPNGPSQEKVIRAALKNAGVAPKEIGFVETHGTGTSLGDPIELQALGAVLAEGRPAGQPAMIGSVKTNMGHLEAAAGVAGLIKTALVLKHGEVPPHLHLQEPNPYVPWDDLPLVVATQRTTWKRGESPRRAGVSSFGMSGTNAHVILEEAPPVRETGVATAPARRLFVLSGRTSAALEDAAHRHEAYLAGNDAGTFDDVCFTAATGRTHFEHRLAISATSAQDVRGALARFGRGEDAPNSTVGSANLGVEPPRVAFLFTGQGAQYLGMGQTLYRSQPVFRDAVNACDDVLRPLLGRSVIDGMHPAMADDKAVEALNDTAFTQPALFVLEYALARLWESWGVRPWAVMGHSLGEYVAACVAGLFTLEDGLRIAVERGRLLGSLAEGGAMASLLASVGVVTRLIGAQADEVDVAAFNGPESIVVSGTEQAVADVLRRADAEGIQGRSLPVSFAGHSHVLDPVLDAFEAIVARTAFGVPNKRIVSNLTGGLAAADELGTPGYWRRHLREPVRFAEGMQTLHALGCRVFIEMGPHSTLLGMGRLCTPDDGCAWLPSLRRDRDDDEQIMESLAQAFTAGVAVDWSGLDWGPEPRRVHAPTYPFQRTTFWPDAPSGGTRPRTGRWDAVLEKGRWQAQQAPVDVRLGDHGERWTHLDELALGYIAHAVGGFSDGTEERAALSVEDLVARHGVDPKFGKVVARWFRRLEQAGYLSTVERDGYRLRADADLPDVEALLDRAHASFGDEPVLPDFVERGGRRLAEVLTGRVDPLDLLFPGGSFDTGTYMYETGPMARYFNNIARAVLEAVAAAQRERPLRILELGAGTGGTTSALLPALHGETMYVFTDVSDVFLDRARSRFAAYDFVRYGLLDIERNPAEQGYAQHVYDVVVAANVLHATRDIDATIRHARSLLAPGGLLVLFETVRHPAWFDVTVGLIEGWGRFEDSYRTDHPLLDADQWHQALLANGFDASVALPEVAETDVLINRVIVARAPGDEADLTGTDAAYAGTSGDGAATGSGAPARPGTAPLLDQLAAQPASRHGDLIREHVRAQVAAVLRVDPPRAVDPNHRLLDLGLDSLMAVELRDRLERSLHAESGTLPATLVFDYPTVDAIARYLAQQVLSQHVLPQSSDDAVAEVSSEADDGESDVPDAEVADIDEVPDEDMEALLLQKIDRISASTLKK